MTSKWWFLRVGALVGVLLALSVGASPALGAGPQPRSAGIVKVEASCVPGATIEVVAHIRLNTDDIVEVQVIRGDTHTQTSSVWGGYSGIFQYKKLSGVVPANAAADGVLQVLVTIGDARFEEKAYSEVATYDCTKGFPKGVGPRPLDGSYYMIMHPLSPETIAAWQAVVPLEDGRVACNGFIVGWWGVKMFTPDSMPGCEDYTPDELTVLCLTGSGEWQATEIQRVEVVGGTVWAEITQQGHCGVFPKAEPTSS